MRKILFLKSSSGIADGLVFLLIITAIYAVSAFGMQWQASYNPTYEINLSLGALPLYALFSALRGLIAYVISLAFTLIIGFWAAKSQKAEKIILPLLDIMQSIPVLGFLPGLVLGLVALFPRTNVGLELASILMIFTGQVWNMTFAFYSSLKSVPTDLQEAAAVMKLTALQRLKLLELPFSAMNLAWNSLMSMAGGWFFLTVCEAFTLGDKPYRLPGLGAYMAVAVEQGDTTAIIAGILTMSAVIILFDIFLWRPALVWAHRFRLEETNEGKIDEPFIQLLIRDSFIARVIKFYYFRPKKFRKAVESSAPIQVLTRRNFNWKFQLPPAFAKFLKFGLFAAFLGVAGYAIFKLIHILTAIHPAEWLTILIDTGYTFVRVLAAVILGTLWATPMGIWIAQSPQRLRVAQPIIQLMASFPAPMLYPLAIAVFLFLHINFEISSMLLMLLGVQWYILFNVLAGSLKIPTELRLAMSLMGSSTYHQWRYLFLPSVLPSLVTGWVTAAGGAWNASIVSEVISYKGQDFVAHGLGADISKAAAHGDFANLSAALVLMVVVVVLLNRTFWSKIYRIAQTRYRLDL